MGDELKNATNDRSRRSFFWLAWACATGGAAAFVVETGNAFAAKFAQKAVFYRPKPSLGQKCSNCKIFVRPHSCRSVEGVISPDGWCVIWRE